MAMTYRRGDDSGEAEPMIEINTTPLIDVMLVLLVMLIITIPIQTHAVKLDMSAAPSSISPPPPPPISIEIGADGTITWDGRAVGDGRDLEERMKTVVADLLSQPELRIRPDGRAAFKHVIAVLAAAQRRGVRNIGIVTAGQFSAPP
ncbi:ExbD/TolR family protein [Telmatospirillum siberiense]|uniref:Biopolymer transporter ExbD n=1 Tax=Telmatospirillum siberiense TaxID=382514 RepID=A0A2N3PPY3_9PROT|nr:biopolymer transporter ExbD [Telmatospirillum siberiense]PKU22461.1 biopolymer transporter ExbD [Telmatospirillum siberiense]